MFNFKRNQAKELSFGSIFEKSPKDFEFVGGIDLKNIPKARNTFAQNKFQYHQPYVNANSCSAHGTGGALSDLVGHQFNLMDFKEIWEQEVMKGNASPAWGGYTYKMIDAWREWWNKLHPEDKVISVAVPMSEPIMFELLEKGYSIAMGYKNHIGYTEDWMADNMINKEWDDNVATKEDYGSAYESGHCLRLVKDNKYEKKGTGLCCVDNYKDSENRKQWDSNIYGVEEDIIRELVQRGVWHAYGYIFVFEKDFVVPVEQVINQKLTERFENRVIFNVKTQKFAVIKNGERIEFKGKDMSELFSIKWGKTNESYVCGIDDKIWGTIGKLKK